MEIRRRQYTAEFKRDAVALVMEQGYTLILAAQNLGITAKLLSRWKRDQQDHRDAAFPGQGHQTPEHAELRRLREDNHRLRMERDILKKATAFFATHNI
jgi:transposase